MGALSKREVLACLDDHLYLGFDNDLQRKCSNCWEEKKNLCTKLLRAIENV